MTFSIHIFQNGMRVLEALSATGLRSIRYAKEVRGIKQIIANDLSSSAVKSIENNIRLNNVEDLITASEANATTLMYNSTSLQSRFDVIDLGNLNWNFFSVFDTLLPVYLKIFKTTDPYGSPAIFLDGAVQSISEGGLLLVTG